MAKSTKIILITLCSLIAVCCVAVGVGTVMKDKDDTTTLPTVSQSENIQSTVPATEKAPDLSELIIGKWRDSADMSGFEFFSDGTVEITYVNLTVPVINLPVNGTTKGTYKLEGDRLTTKFSIYSATIEDSYKISVDKNELSMTDLEELEKATYMRVSESETITKKTTTHPSTEKDGNSVLYDDELIGSWEAVDGTKYSFDYDGSAEITKDGESFNGIYLTDSGKITLQYAANGKKITEKYSYTVSKNSLSFVKDGEEILFVREGTGNVSASDDELLGVWRDGANMSGFEFKPDGICDITYVNFTVPVVNIPINGTFTGSYSVKGNKLTVTASIYGSSTRDVYKFSISGNTLTLENTENGEVFTLTKQ